VGKEPIEVPKTELEKGRKGGDRNLRKKNQINGIEASRQRKR